MGGEKGDLALVGRVLGPLVPLPVGIEGTAPGPPRETGRDEEAALWPYEEPAWPEC